jgi:hypothetical protein
MDRRNPFWAHDRWGSGFGSHNPAWQELHDYDFEIRDYRAGSLAEGYRDWREYRRQREAESAGAVLPYDAPAEVRRWRNWQRQRQRPRQRQRQRQPARHGDAERSRGYGRSYGGEYGGRAPGGGYGRYDRDLLGPRYGRGARAGYEGDHGGSPWDRGGPVREGADPFMGRRHGQGPGRR